MNMNKKRSTSFCNPDAQLTVNLPKVIITQEQTFITFQNINTRNFMQESWLRVCVPARATIVAQWARWMCMSLLAGVTVGTADRAGLT